MGGSGKTVEVWIMQFSPYSSLIPPVFVLKFHPEILTGSAEWGRQTREGWGKQAITLNVNISKMVRYMSKVTISD